MNDTEMTSVAAVSESTDLDELIRAAERSVIERDERIRRTVGAAKSHVRDKGSVVLATAGFALLLSRLLSRRPRTGRASSWLRGIGVALPLARVLLPAIEQGLASRSFARREIEPLPPVISAEHVDLERFYGTWYEIVSLPASGSERGAQEAAATCVTSFAPILGRRCLAVTRQSRLPDGRVRTRRGEVYVVEGSGNARLRMSLMPRFLRCLPGVWRDYWILMTDDTYQTALVGTPDRRNLWLLSRTLALSAADEERLIDHARRQQFRTDALLRT